MEISYGQGPCDEHYIPPDENGQCPEGHQFVDEETGCVPDEFGLLPPCNGLKGQREFRLSASQYHLIAMLKTTT
jgi:hypothetical protein